MVKYSEKALILVLLLLLLNLDQICSQELGNPISNLNTNEFSVSLYGERVWRKMDDADYDSYRLITKTEFGFYNRLKIYGLIGAEKMYIDYPVIMYIDYPVISSFTDYKGDTEYALGIGCQLGLFNIKKTSFFSGAGILKLSPKGSLMSTVSEEQIQIDMKFNWREYWFAFGASHEMKRFEIFGGIEGRTTKRIELNTETEYISGLKPNIFLGFDFFFPKNFVLNFRAKILDQNAFSIGISQRSIGKLK